MVRIDNSHILQTEFVVILLVEPWVYTDLCVTRRRNELHIRVLDYVILPRVKRSISLYSTGSVMCFR